MDESDVQLWPPFNQCFFTICLPTPDDLAVSLSLLIRAFARRRQVCDPSALQSPHLIPTGEKETNSHPEISMDIPIPHIPPNLRHKDIHLLPPPPHRPRQQRHRETLQALLHIHQVPPPNLLQPPVPRPPVRRPREAQLHHVHEARLPHPRRVAVRAVHGPPRHAGRLEEEVRPFLEAGPRVGVVRRQAGQDVVLQFEPAAGREVGVAGGDECGEGAEGAGHEARVDEVEGVVEEPCVFGVVYYEGEVGGYAVSLSTA